MRLNPAVTLTKPSGTEYLFAALVSDVDSSRWEFLVNPSTLEFGVGVGTSSMTLLGGVAPYEQFKAVDALTLRLGDLVLSTPGRSAVTPLLRSLQALVERGTKVSFTWGSKMFGPCLVSSLSWVETEWASGEVVAATLSLELRKGGDVGEAPTVTKPKESAPTLTERQKAEQTRKAEGKGAKPK